MLIRGPLADTVIRQEETADLFKSPLGSTVEGNREFDDVGARRMERWEEKGSSATVKGKLAEWEVAESKVDPKETLDGWDQD